MISLTFTDPALRDTLVASYWLKDCEQILNAYYTEKGLEVQVYGACALGGDVAKP